MDDDEPVTADDIRQQVNVDAKNGAKQFADGTNNVTLDELKNRLAIAEAEDRRTASALLGWGLRFTTLNGPGAW